MKTKRGWASLALTLLIVFAGCTKQPSDKQADNATPPNAQQRSPQAVPPEQTAPPPEGETAPPVVAPAQRPDEQRSKSEAAAPKAPTPAATTGSAAQKPTVSQAKKPALKPKDVVTLTGNPMGGVKLQHKLHAERAANKCETCHHPSKAQKPATAPQQKCSACHTKTAMPPMKTKYQAAFHAPTAQSGTCIDCHKAQNAKGKKAPVKCVDCHKKENK